MNQTGPHRKSELLIVGLVLLLGFVGIKNCSKYNHESQPQAPISVQDKATPEQPRIQASAHVQLEGPASAILGTCFQVKASLVDYFNKPIHSDGVRVVFDVSGASAVFVSSDPSCEKKDKSAPIEGIIPQNQDSATFYLLPRGVGSLSAKAYAKDGSLISVRLKQTIEIKDEEFFHLEFSNVPDTIEAGKPFSVSAFIKKSKIVLADQYLNPVELYTQEPHGGKRVLLKKEVPRRGMLLFNHLVLPFNGQTELKFSILSGELKAESRLVKLIPAGSKVLNLFIEKEFYRMVFVPPNKYLVSGKTYTVNNPEKDLVEVNGKKYKITKVSENTYQLVLAQ